MGKVQYRFKPRRKLGKTGFIATALGIGDVADRAVPFGECVATVRRAMDAGLNVVDTAPGYEDGYSERIVGEALKGRRDRIFVIDKIDLLDEPISPQVDGSLRRMKLEMVDLFVFHGPSTMALWKKLSRPGGGMDQLAECVSSGKVRFRGISSHHPEILHAAIESGLCDVVLFAVGPYCDARYVEEILPLARRRGVGTVCFKTLGAGKLVADTTGYNAPLQARPRGKISSGGRESTDEPRLPHLSVRDCVHYTMSCDPDVALLGLSFPNEQDAAFEAAREFKPLLDAQMTAIRRRAKEAMKGKGPCWWNPPE